MRRIRLTLVAALALCVPSLAWGAVRTIDFDGPEYGTPDDNCLNNPQPPLFNRPESGGQTSAYIVDPAGCGKGALNIDNGSDSLLTGFFGSSGMNSNEVRFSWVDPTNDDTWLRLLTQDTSTVFPKFRSPTVHLGIGSKIRVDLLAYGTSGAPDEFESTSGGLEVALIVRETGKNLPLGEDGGVNGTLEFIGLDSKGGGTDLNTPVGGTPISHSAAGTFTSIEYKFIDAGGGQVGVQVSVNGDAPVLKSIVPFTGDGVLLADHNRGTLDGIAVRKPAGDDTTKKWFVNIDTIVIDSGALLDPVKVDGPILESEASATVSFINIDATEVKLYKNGALLTSAPAPFSDEANRRHTFTGLSLAAGDELTATQVIGGVESGPSDVQTVLSAVVWSDNFDGYADQAAFDAVWKRTTGTIDFELAADEAASCPQSAKEPAAATGTDPYRRYVDLVTVAGVNDLNGSDAVPLWITWYFRHQAHTNQRNWLDLRNYVAGVYSTAFPGHIYQIGCYNGAATGNYNIRDYGDGGPEWMDSGLARKNNQWVKMQIKLTSSATEYWIDNVLAVSTARFGPNDPITTVLLGSGLSNSGSPAWFDNLSFSLGAAATDPFGPPAAVSPTVAGPLSPTNDPASVTVNGISTAATQVNVWAGSTQIGTAAVANETTKIVSVSSLPNGQMITATQVIDGVETCRSAARGAAAVVPAPVVQAPLASGVTSVMVTGVSAQATEVRVYVNGAVHGTATMSGATSAAVTVTPALVDGDQVQATQVVGGFESPLSTPPVTVFTQGVGTLRVALSVRELAAGKTGPVGANGGTTTNRLEWIGSSTTGTPTPTKNIVPGGGWQTITFDPATDTIKSFANGNSVLNSDSPPWYTLESLALRIDGTSPKQGPYTLYIDNVTNAGVNFGDFEAYAAQTGTGGTVLFRQPSYSGSSVGLAASPNASIVSTDRADGGTKALKVQWAYTSPSTGNWLRLTTNNVANLGNPMIDLGADGAWKPVTMRVLLCGAPEVTIGNILAVGGTTVQVTSVSTAAESVTVYANGSAIGTAPGNGTTSVEVTVPPMVTGQAITATQTIGGAEGCGGAGKTVGACNQVASPSFAGPLVAGSTAVTINGIHAQASEVIITSNGSPIGTIDPLGLATVSVPTSALTGGATLAVTQVVSTQASCPANAVVGSNTNARIKLSLGVKEVSTNIEWVGATEVIDGAPQGKAVDILPTWQTVTFTAADSVKSFSGGNGVIDGAVTLEHLAISIDSAAGETGPYVMYVDNVTNGATVVEDFEAGTPGARLFFQAPNFSGTTDVDLLANPDVLVVDGQVRDTGAKSARASWQWVDTTAQRWVRLTTSPLAPPIDLSQGVSFRILLLPAFTCNTPWADADGDNDVDQADFAAIQRCITTAGTGADAAVVGNCACFDKGAPSGLINADDIAAFAACATGPDITFPATPPVGCAP